MDSQNSFPQATAIVVDDNHDTSAVFSEYLEMSGIKVLATGQNGKDAVDLYKKCAPDFVFTDLMMPDYDGYYATEKIKELNCGAKIIVITADASQDVVEKLTALGADEILYKPCDVDNLIQAINLLQRGRSLRVAS